MSGTADHSKALAFTGHKLGQIRTLKVKLTRAKPVVNNIPPNLQDVRKGFGLLRLQPARRSGCFPPGVDLTPAWGAYQPPMRMPIQLSSLQRPTQGPQ